MKMDGLNSFSEAEQGEKAMENDLSNSYPAHRSEWTWLRKTTNELRRMERPKTDRAAVYPDLNKEMLV
jgi:hypothetical protein